eukprot:123694-Pyramimonas_sp.AAC.1
MSNNNVAEEMRSSRADSSNNPRTNAASSAEDPRTAVPQCSSASEVHCNVAALRTFAQSLTRNGNSPKALSPPLGLGAIAPMTRLTCGGHIPISSI